MKKLLKENGYFSILFGVMGIYYLYRLFSITPWYDEVYTYLNFIDKGAIYSATHWPLPNNHVFFSVASAPFRIFGVYIGLRGVSYLAALGTLLFLYLFLKDIYSKNIAFASCIAYCTLLLPNQLAIQGRGYSLATFLLMLAIYCGYRICFQNATKTEYIFWILALWLGLYTLVSSVYWVTAICLCCGITLLAIRKFKELLKLISASLIAACFTLVSYGILWLNIGAQQISQDAATGYLGAKIGFLIWEFPRTCFMRGMNVMLNDPNVQSFERRLFLQDFKYFARGILAEFFGKAELSTWYLLIVIVFLFVILWCILAIKLNLTKQNTNAPKKLFSIALSGIGFLGVFLTLLVQSAYPFSRVFSFMGIFFTILFASILGEFSKPGNKFLIHKKIEKYILYINPTILLVCICLLTNTAHTKQYDMSDYWSEDAIQNIDWTEIKNCLATDIFSKQQIQYQCNSRYHAGITFDSETPDVIFVKKGNVNGAWPYIITQEQLNQYNIENRSLLYENEFYYVYGK